MALLIFGLTACSGNKPFQPPPPVYTTWAKEGVTQEEVKQAMRSCGYKDLYGYGGDRNATLEDRVMREKCMFRSGFKYKDDFRGLCSLRGMDSVSSCNEKTIPEKENRIYR